MKDPGYLSGVGPLSLAVLILLPFRERAFSDSSPFFALPRWGDSGKVRLEDFQGKIVVVDFFAYWCLPCQSATPVLEKEVRQFYAAANGNPQGFEVVVLSINVERSHPEKTAAFIKKHQLALVLNDPDGEAFKKFGGTGMPLILVIDGTRSRPGAFPFEIVYRSEGFEGVGKIKQVVNAIGVQAKEASQATPFSAPTHEASHNSIPRIHQSSLDFEAVWASDILLTAEQLQYKQTGPNTEWSISLFSATMDFDYQPVSFDFLGHPSEVSHQRYGVLGILRYRLNPKLTLLGSAGAYHGFVDYRSAWLAEYFRQQFSAFSEPGSIPGDLYREPDPKGYSFSGGLRWEYLPASGSLQAEVGYARDIIAPGYEIDFTGLKRGLDTLNTTTVSLTAENVLASRIRVLNEGHIIDTTARQVRYNYQGSVNIALGENWVMRAYGGYTAENPKFEAFYFGGSLEWEVAPSVLASVNGQYYKDTGEIENSNFTTAAPGVRTWQLGFGLRYQFGRSALKVYYAPFYQAIYEPITLQTVFFSNLYKNRDFSVVQFAYSYAF